MAHKYCPEHKLWYDYDEGCPECTKIPKFIGNAIGNIVGGSICGLIWAGKKVYNNLTEDNKKAEEKLFCSKCGSNLMEGAVFCSKCGTKI
jgi:ribosomal protein L40E